MDYEDDSDEEDEQETDNAKTSKPAPVSQPPDASSSNSTTPSSNKEEISIASQQEKTVDETKNESDAQMTFGVSLKGEPAVLRKHKKEDDHQDEKTGGNGEDVNENEANEQPDAEDDSQTEINGQAEPANKRARLSST